jgi:hypothetical protein
MRVTGSKLRAVNAVANWPATANGGFIFQFPAIIIGQIPLSLPPIIVTYHWQQSLADVTSKRSPQHSLTDVRWRNITRSNVIMPAF